MQEAVATASDGLLYYFSFFLYFSQPLFPILELNLKPGSLSLWEVQWKQWSSFSGLSWPVQARLDTKCREGTAEVLCSTAQPSREVLAKQKLAGGIFNVPLCYVRGKCFQHSLPTLSPAACFFTSQKSRNLLKFQLGWERILWHSGILSKNQPTNQTLQNQTKKLTAVLGG